MVEHQSPLGRSPKIVQMCHPGLGVRYGSSNCQGSLVYVESWRRIRPSTSAEEVGIFGSSMNGGNSESSNVQGKEKAQAVHCEASERRLTA